MGTAAFTDFDKHLLAEGKYFRGYQKMGAHIVEEGGQRGVRFTLWAPNARQVSVIGDFNGWNFDAHRMEALPESRPVAELRAGNRARRALQIPHRLAV